jgi:hypothetical protein
MQKNYYQNTLYPLQDRVLRMMEKLPVDFYLTGGTALSRAYLNHRYSDDLDFFLNNEPKFSNQVETFVKALNETRLKFEISVTGDSFARLFIYEADSVLKIDFVNDIPYRTGLPVITPLYNKTDIIPNILTNKLTALGRYSAKDIVDLVFISLNFSFNWVEIMKEAAEKDMWINAIEASKILDSFPLTKLEEIVWVKPLNDVNLFEKHLHILIGDILKGGENSLNHQG